MRLHHHGTFQASTLRLTIRNRELLELRGEIEVPSKSRRSHDLDCRVSYSWARTCRVEHR